MQTGHATRILIVYYSRYGTVKALATLIAAGAQREPGVETRLFPVADEPIESSPPNADSHGVLLRRAQIIGELVAADAIIVGSPAYFGSMASPVKRLFEDCATASTPPTNDRTRPWRHHLFRDKVGAAFTSSGTPHGGNEQCLHSILTMLIHLGMVIVTPGQQEPILENLTAPYGATTVAGPHGDSKPTADEAEAARALGQRVARLTTWLIDGRDAWEERHGMGVIDSREHPFPPV